MSLTNIHEAESRLAELVDRAMSGEEVIIARAGKPMVRLTPVGVDDPPRVGGQWRGRVRIAEDFDALPDDIAAAFGVEPRRPCPRICTSSPGIARRPATPRPRIPPNPCQSVGHRVRSSPTRGSVPCTANAAGGTTTRATLTP